MEDHGSRIDFLNWVERPDFTKQLTCLLCPTGATVQAQDVWMPKSFCYHKEARLNQLEKCFGPKLHRIDWEEVWNWWLVKKANTPNWDLASTCKIRGQKGLVIVEGKAHVGELETKGKKKPNRSDSRNSHKNHERIGQAIDEASRALDKIVPGVNITRDTHYQLANRVAFSWKIASMGIPVILVYLGFLEDKVWPCDLFKDNAHWEQEMKCYMKSYIPQDFIERDIDCGKAKMWMIVRSLKVSSSWSFQIVS